MKRNNVYVIVLLSSLYAWLLSFPMQGPALEALGNLKSIDYSEYFLIFTGFHALGLIISPFIVKKYNNHKRFMTIDGIICLIGTILMMLLELHSWGLLMTIMAVASADFIIRWSYFYIHSTAIVGRMKFMAATIITANVYYAALSTLRVFLSPQYLLFLVIIPLIVIILFVHKIDSLKSQAQLNESKDTRLPIIFILMLSNLIFGIFINCGFMNMVIYPYYWEYYNIHLFYESVPYIGALLVMYYLGDRVQRTLPVYLGGVFIISAFASFVFLPKTVYSYFLVETFMQAAYAFVNVFFWTLLGDAASVYGHTSKIFGYTLFANVFSILAGGLIGQRLSLTGSIHKSITGIFSLVILFLVISIVPWISRHIKDKLEVKDILDNEKKENLAKNNMQVENDAENSYINAKLSSLKNIELLTPRELEIAALLINGCTNKQICAMLYITENTLKIHNRHIYSKLMVNNRKELMQQVFLPTDLSLKSDI